MAFYDNSQWSAGPGQPQRQPSWEQPPPPSRSGTSSVGASQDSGAFLYQLAEVERAIDNLVKSGKMPFGFFAAGAGPMYGQGAGPRSVGGDFDGRPHSNSGLQNYYQNQRGGYGSHRGQQGGGEQAQMEQAKRRMAAQRERELRNYHQEQQYAKSMTTSGNTGPKSDRSMSPNTGMSEDERRELIARQHRALYGNDANLYEGKGGSRPGSGDARNMGPMGGPRGSGSPLAFDPYSQGGPEGAVQMPSRGADAHGNKDGSGSASHSPANNQNPTFGGNDNARTSNSSPTGGSPPGSKNSGAGVIGRPQGSQGPVQGLQKRSTTPLPSPLSYGFSANDQSANERSTSASSQDKNNAGLGWGSNSGVWGQPKSGLGVQASVWG